MMSKKIHFDSRWIGEHGIGRFAKEILVRNPSFSTIESTIKPSSPFDVFFTTFFVAFNRGLYFTPGYNAPLLFHKKTILTVHDLNHVDIDHNSSFLKKVYYNFVLKRACKNALNVLTVSEFSKRRICDWAKINPDKVKVVGNGVSSEFHEEVIPHDDKYILVVGNRKKHKNEMLSLEAFALSNIPKDYKLIFTGDSTEELVNKVEELGLKNRVVFFGRVDNSKLASLYKGALVLLFPSLYEGFGLPVIESMACGTPVITSNTTSLPEVSGDAALLVTPTDINEIKNAIELIFNDSVLREKLIQKGIERSKIFTWDTTVSKINNVLNQ